MAFYNLGQEGGEVDEELLATALAGGFGGILKGIQLNQAQQGAAAERTADVFGKALQFRHAGMEAAREESRFAETKRHNAATEAAQIRDVPVFNPVDGRMVMVPRGSRISAPPGASAAQSKVSSARNLLAVLDMQAKKIDDLPTGRAYGAGSKFLNKWTGMMPDVGVFEAIHGATTPIFARVVSNEVGNLNEQEQLRAKEINPTLVKTTAELKGMIAFSRNVLRRQIAENENIGQGGMFGGGMSQAGQARMTALQPSAPAPTAPAGRAPALPAAVTSALAGPWEDKTMGGRPVRARELPNGQWEVED